MWAKSGEAFGHGLLAHLLDVAAVAEVLLQREPEATRRWAASRLGFSLAELPRWVAAGAGLHDFGKGIPGFQFKWPEGAQRDLAAGLPFPTHACEAARHDAATALLLEPVWHEACEAPLSWLQQVVRAISAHHGFYLGLNDVAKARPRREPVEWNAARREIFAAYWQCLSPQGLPAKEMLDLSAMTWLAGLTSIADWIASNPEWFPQGERCVRLDDYYAGACQLAERALDAIDWRLSPLAADATASTVDLMSRMLGTSGAEPRPLQLAGDALLASAAGPCLLLVEAPMGEGKTELAFLAWLRLQAANQHRGLYMALPTQATGNAMFQRLLPFLQAFLEHPGDIQLVHGGAAMNPEWVRLRDIDHSRAETLSASSWFAQRRRPLLSPYGVGTIDQALLGVLCTKHHFVRLWGLANRVVVLDEVHAYDTYTSGLMVALLEWLKSLGSSVILMSATLPAKRRQQLLQAWDRDLVDTEEDVAYPRLSVLDGRGLRQQHVAARPMATIQWQGLVESIDTMAALAGELAGRGGCVAVVVNTVGRAQALFRLLQAECGEDVQLLLFHARFPADQRSALEGQVLATFGKDGVRPAKAILVATQVIEQSLDVDFDVMLSDLAPVDLLLQRAGRLHRHRRARPEPHRVPVLHVAGLVHDRFPDIKTTHWGHVYDPYILGRSWAFLRHESQCQLPQDIDRLVQTVYDDAVELPDDLQAEHRDYIEFNALGEHLVQVKQQRTRAFGFAIRPMHDPDTAYSDKVEQWADGETLGDVWATRLGPESITLVPVQVRAEGWVLPDGSVFDPGQPLNHAQVAQLYARQLKISRAGLVRHFKSKPPCPAFASQVLLQRAFPLPLTDGRYDADGESLWLDERLGLVFEEKA